MTGGGAARHRRRVVVWMILLVFCTLTVANEALGQRITIQPRPSNGEDPAASLAAQPRVNMTEFLFEHPQVQMLASIHDRYGNFLIQASIGLGSDNAFLASVIAAAETYGNAFDENGRMIIRFDPDRFKVLLKNNVIFSKYFNASGSTFRVKPSGPWQRIHANQDTEWATLQLAQRLDNTAALAVTTFGIAQIRGLNARLIGFKNANEMFIQFSTSLGRQLDGLTDLIRAKPNCLKAARTEDFEGFARCYDSILGVDEYTKKLKLAYEAYLAVLRKLKVPSMVKCQPQPGLYGVCGVSACSGEEFQATSQCGSEAKCCVIPSPCTPPSGFKGHGTCMNPAQCSAPGKLYEDPTSCGSLACCVNQLQLDFIGLNDTRSKVLTPPDGPPKDILPIELCPKLGLGAEVTSNLRCWDGTGFCAFDFTASGDYVYHDRITGRVPSPALPRTVTLTQDQFQVQSQFGRHLFAYSLAHDEDDLPVCALLAHLSMRLTNEPRQNRDLMSIAGTTCVGTDDKLNCPLRLIDFEILKHTLSLELDIGMRAHYWSKETLICATYGAAIMIDGNSVAKIEPTCINLRRVSNKPATTAPATISKNLPVFSYPIVPGVLEMNVGLSAGFVWSIGIGLCDKGITCYGITPSIAFTTSGNACATLGHRYSASASVCLEVKGWLLDQELSFQTILSFDGLCAKLVRRSKPNKYSLKLGGEVTFFGSTNSQVWEEKTKELGSIQTETLYDQCVSKLPSAPTFNVIPQAIKDNALKVIQKPTVLQPIETNARICTKVALPPSVTRVDDIAPWPSYIGNSIYFIAGENTDSLTFQVYSASSGQLLPPQVYWDDLNQETDHCERHLYGRFPVGDVHQVDSFLWWNSCVIRLFRVNSQAAPLQATIPELSMGYDVYNARLSPDQTFLVVALGEDDYQIETPSLTKPIIIKRYSVFSSGLSKWGADVLPGSSWMVRSGPERSGMEVSRKYAFMLCNGDRLSVLDLNLGTLTSVQQLLGYNLTQAESLSLKGNILYVLLTIGDYEDPARYVVIAVDATTTLPIRVVADISQAPLRTIDVRPVLTHSLLIADLSGVETEANPIKIYDLSTGTEVPYLCNWVNESSISAISASTTTGAAVLTVEVCCDVSCEANCFKVVTI